MYLPRAITQTFRQALTAFPIILVSGPRRSGKTTFLKETMKDVSAYVTFDDPVTRQQAADDPRGFLQQFGNQPVIIDEIQYEPSILPYIKMEVDNAQNGCGKWLLTSSQQFNLMRNVSDSLAGRICILNLLPFFVEEHGREAHSNIETALWLGGYPEVLLHPQNRDLWISSYVNTYIERDIRYMQNIQNLSLFQSFMSLCAAYHGQELSYATLSRKLGISQPTVKQWITLASASFVLLLLKPFYQNYGKRLIKSQKLYFIDAPIAAYLTRQSSKDTLFAGSMGGAFFEGFIVTETYKTLIALHNAADIYFWRSHDQTEVDLIIEHGGAIYPIEIKKTSTPTRRHAAPLEKFRSFVKDRKVGRGVVVCTVDKIVPLGANVVAMPWREYLRWVAET